MNTFGLVYFTTGGNTESMAETLRDALEAKGAEVYFSAVGEADADEFFSKDVLLFGSPAQGTEGIDEGEMLPFIEDNADKLEGKKVFMFGSYGWGGGEYMENWKNDIMDQYNVTYPAGTVVTLEAPTDETEEQLQAAAEQLVEA